MSDDQAERMVKAIEAIKNSMDWLAISVPWMLLWIYISTLSN